MAELTDLEGTALGCVFRQGECTAHYVRGQFRTSVSPRFSDSTGSIYPLMRRLEQRGLLVKATRKEGQRKVDYYRCSPAGRVALKRWVGPPHVESDAITIDPLRTKLVCLSVLTPRQRVLWIEQAETILQDKLREIEARVTSLSGNLNDLFIQLAHENAAGQLRANLKWLKDARERIVADA